MTHLFSVNVLHDTDVITYFIDIEDLDTIKRVLQKFEEKDSG